MTGFSTYLVGSTFFLLGPLFFLPDSDTTAAVIFGRRMNVNLCNGVLTKNWVIPRIVMGDIYGYLSSRTIALPGPIMIAPYVAFHDYFFQKIFTEQWKSNLFNIKISLFSSC